IGGGGTYAAIGARIWYFIPVKTGPQLKGIAFSFRLPPNKIGMIVDTGNDFPQDIKDKLHSYGSEMWLFREQPNRGTTRALNSYRGDHRGFEYTTPRIRLTPKDLRNTKLEKPEFLHFICSPTRALSIIAEIDDGWSPTTIYEPIPDRCVPQELPSLIKVLPSISVLSPNAEEALSLLSLPLPPVKSTIESAARRFLDLGVGRNGQGWVIIRSGAMGAFIQSNGTEGRWIEAYWTKENIDKVVDVTGAGNAFLGGLAAGMALSEGDIPTATLYATVSASFVIEQEGLPPLDSINGNIWNGESASQRLDALRKRHESKAD
ncbi:hypothetical protein CVT24_004831, partial [Panaeolus cyanescens]